MFELRVLDRSEVERIGDKAEETTHRTFYDRRHKIGDEVPIELFPSNILCLAGSRHYLGNAPFFLPLIPLTVLIAELSSSSISSSLLSSLRASLSLFLLPLFFCRRFRLNPLLHSSSTRRCCGGLFPFPPLVPCSKARDRCGLSTSLRIVHHGHLSQGHQPVRLIRYRKADCGYESSRHVLPRTHSRTRRETPALLCRSYLCRCVLFHRWG